MYPSLGNKVVLLKAMERLHNSVEVGNNIAHQDISTLDIKPYHKDKSNKNVESKPWYWYITVQDQI